MFHAFAKSITDDRTLSWYDAAGCCKVVLLDITCSFKTKLHWIANMVVGLPAIDALLAGPLQISQLYLGLLHALIMRPRPLLKATVHSQV